MTDNPITKDTTLQELAHFGGTARAQTLSPERRKEIAIKASNSRKCMKGFPKATHMGELGFGDNKIVCAVLEDGTRVINEGSVFQALGISRKGRKGKDGTKMPAFLSAANLMPFIPNDLDIGTESLTYLTLKSGKGYGYKATDIPKICKIYLDARHAGVLKPQQIPIARAAEIIIHSLAQTGIIALVDEATGYQRDRENNELQKLFTAFIAKELQPWVKRFPDDFFGHMKRMYGLDEMKKTPKFFGCLINKYIYKELSPEIHEELKRINPITESGSRKHKHHQLLTQDIGCPALEKQIHKVTTLMSVSDSKEDFERLLEKSKS